MEFKYGQSLVYNLDKTKLDWLTSQTNRSKSQTLFLFQLVDGDFEKLKALETQIKNCFIFYCPDTMDEVKQIMKLKSDRKHFKLL